MRRLITMLGAAAALAAISAPALGSGTTVAVGHYKFTPKTIHVRKGQTVTWRWIKGNDDLHNVKFKSFHSRSQKSGTFSHTFRKAGTYTYICTFHVHSHGMRGTVIVS